VATNGAFTMAIDTGVTQGQAEQELVRFITWSRAGIPQPERIQHCLMLLLPPGAPRPAPVATTAPTTPRRRVTRTCSMP
jgi:hypothetical protein